MFRRHLNVLGLKSSYNEQELKKAYYKKALLYHPDKTKNNDDSEFKKVNEAYQYLKYYLENKDFNEREYMNTTSTHRSAYTTPYKVFDKSFFIEYIKMVMKIDIETIYVIETLLNKTNKISSYMMKNMNIRQLRRIEKFLKDYKSSCKSLYKIIHNIIQNYKHNKKIQIYNINTSINDLLESNIYILEHNDEKYYIPLWYNELEYDEFIVNIHLDLSDNIVVDTDNNIQVYVNIQDIPGIIDISNNQFEMYTYTHYFNKNIKKVIEIEGSDISKLKDNIIDNITITIKNEGILKINTNVEKIFEKKNNSEDKSDIYFIIYNRKC